MPKAAQRITAEPSDAALAGGEAAAPACEDAEGGPADYRRAQLTELEVWVGAGVER